MTTVTADALNRLPDSTQPQAADKSDIAAASGADDAAAGEAGIKTALKRLQTMMGASDQADLTLKLFAEPSAPTCASEEGGSRTDKVLLLDLRCNTWVERDASELRVGDVVKVLKTQRFPADLLLLHASSPTEVSHTASNRCVGYRRLHPLSLLLAPIRCAPTRKGKTRAAATAPHDRAR